MYLVKEARQKNHICFPQFPFQFPDGLLMDPAETTTSGSWDDARSLLLFWKSPRGRLQLLHELTLKSNQIATICLKTEITGGLWVWTNIDYALEMVLLTELQKWSDISVVHCCLLLLTVALEGVKIALS